MELSSRSSSVCFDFIIKADRVVIEEDMSVPSKGKWVVPEDFIQQLITVAFDANRHNNVSDVDTIKMIIGNFLNDGEKQDLLEQLTETI